MNVKQNLSILFFPKNQKLTKQGKTTIYVRVTIDGLKEEFSSGIQVLPDDWNSDTKMVTSTAPKAKDLNKKIGQIKADLERHFDLVQAKDQIAYPQAVIAAYKTPVNGHYQLQQKKENLEFSVLLDGIIEDYVNLCKRMKREKERCKVSPERIELFHNQKLSIKEQLKEMEKNSRKLFDNQNRIKTLMLAVDEYLLHFMQLALVGERSENSLEKWMGRKKRYLEFLNFRFKTSDLPLSKLEFKFLGDLKTFIIVHHNCEENTEIRKSSI